MPPPEPEGRRRLAAAQADLVRALTGAGPPPPGFAAERLRAAAAALHRKRLRSAARAWPQLARALGGDFKQRFLAFAARVPLPELGGPLADGYQFARELLARSELPAAALAEFVAADLYHTAGPRGLRPRRGPAVRLRLLRGPRRLLLAGRCPGLGAGWLLVPLGPGEWGA
jgi:hypothetical protein